MTIRREDILYYSHCKKCMDQIPDGMSPRDYADYEIGVTKDFLIVVWCKRHDELVKTWEIGNIKEEIESLKTQTCVCPECQAEMDEMLSSMN